MPGYFGYRLSSCEDCLAWFPALRYPRCALVYYKYLYNDDDKDQDLPKKRLYMDDNRTDALTCYDTSMDYSE